MTSESRSIPMSRARLYVVIDAFERDIQSIYARYIQTELAEEDALGGALHKKATQRRNDDPAAMPENTLVEYLDLKEVYDLLNVHRQLLPSELEREIRELTPNVDRIVAVRKRVMHPRPLLAGDADSTPSLLNQFQSRWWSDLRQTLSRLDADPTWEPATPKAEDTSIVLHNLPLPDYDETGLVGRSKEVSDLVSLLKRRRESVVTVIGEGGIGKTALALEVAYTLADDPDSPYEAILWTSLKSEKLTASGIREIAGATRDLTGAVLPLGQAIDSGFTGSLTELADALAGLTTLVVFDNLETIGGTDFGTLYDSLPDTTTYLITSRVGLGQFERRYPLPQLSERDSLHLLNDFIRARRVHALQRVTGEARKVIVQRLRFNPLAIRWFVLAVEAGREPLSLIRDQGEVLEFCVRSVFEGLDKSARTVLTGLAVLGNPATTDELVLLLEMSTDDINLGIQELLRGSLVRRDASPVPGDLSMSIRLTDTASRFLSERVTLERSIAHAITKRHEQYRRTEERRTADVRTKSLAPIVVRVRDQGDVPSAQILRRALLASQSQDFETAFEEVGLARKLNPEFWEVDRVEGFLRATTGEFGAATTAYLKAYEEADEEGRAAVAHFLAGHLARNLHDVEAALPYAREAHAYLATPETAVALGMQLVWIRDFEEGIALIESAVPAAQGRQKLIATSSLASAYSRWAEHSYSAEHNPHLEYKYAKRGLDISLAAFESGVADEKLRDIATRCAETALDGAARAEAASLPIPRLSLWLDELATALVRIYGTKSWRRLIAAIERIHRATRGSAAATRLRDRARELDSNDDTTMQTQLVGEVLQCVDSYGFIRHPRYPNNVFFHGDDVVDGDLSSVQPGQLVRFSVVEGNRGPRAYGVAPA